MIATTVTQVDLAPKTVKAAGETMGLIVDSIRTVGDTVDAIARASTSKPQASGRSMWPWPTWICNTQQNAAMVEQASAAAASLVPSSEAGASIGSLRTV